MAELREEVTALIRADKLEGTVDRLLAFLGERSPDLTKELTEHGRTLESGRRQARRGLLTDADENVIRRKVTFALLDLLDEILKARGVDTPLTQETSAAAQAFISYSHQDREAAASLAQALRSAGIVVLIDDNAMRAGESIESFLKESIAKADVTVSLVSRTSLLSAWVAIETIQAFEQGRFDRKKQFIAGYLDDEFFRPDFRLTDEGDR
jgi:TIR domain/Effector-associated domain 11